MCQSKSGTYILILNLKKTCKIKVGSLGTISFNPGIYAYVGSGIKSLDKRIERHLKKKKKLYWHIDYFLKKATIKAIITIESEKKMECEIAHHLSKHFEVIEKFGSSDCHCKGHLFILKRGS